jgi:hypothetical protein
MSAADERLALGEAALLSPSQAARMIGGNEAETMEWLRSRGLVRTIPGLGRKVVIWGEVLEAIRQPEAAPEPQRGRGSLRRARLD